uniref:EF-hand domain-containing protein n=1 Tax=Nothoprocta perdicaria TaxID=30464 RepID=A0A8C6ZS31_NOTPE
MARLQENILSIITAFHTYARRDGDRGTLSKEELRQLIHKMSKTLFSFSCLFSLQNPHDSQTIDKILHFLEWDGDGKIDFNEFLFLVFRVAKACYWYLQK